MKLSEIVNFRKDLLFNGAVQIGWLETDTDQAEKAARHYVFHGSDYHGVTDKDFESDEHKLVDTVKFTHDILEYLNEQTYDEPFALAIAGYGTGKSHLGVTLASLLREPRSELARTIIRNIFKADANIGEKIEGILLERQQPYIVVAINGMQDFDLNGEIIRQVISILTRKGIDTTPLENLRPRFKSAINFTESFYNALKTDFNNYFGGASLETITDQLKQQDENVFRKVSDIYEQKMGLPIRAIGQESLHDFIKTTNETYCGEGKPFAGLVIIFDEFGRYMEFSVQKPHVAGSGALQQLFESVQANANNVYLICFIQYELKAYISRVAPELRDDLNRYVTRYDSVRKVRLSTNLETLIANLLEKKNISEIERYVSVFKSQSDLLYNKLFTWFPEMKNHAVWADKKRFEKIICKGCWPFHPLSIWVLFKLASVGKSLQQRSAISFLADAYLRYENREIEIGKTIMPVDICNDDMINEFLASERYGQQGASAHAYESAFQKYQHELSTEQKNLLKAVLLMTKIGIKLESKEDCLNALSWFTGLYNDASDSAVNILVSEYGILEWNERFNCFEIVGDAIPKRAFLSYLDSKVSEIGVQRRSEIFSQSYVKLSQTEIYSTDFGSENRITTRDWNYKIYYSNAAIMEGQILFSLRNWYEANNIDECKGQLIYCYVGPESNINSLKEKIRDILKTQIEKIEKDYSSTGVPIAIILLHDEDGSFGQKIVEYWVLNEQMSEEEQSKYSNFILDRKNLLTQDIINQFSKLEHMRNIIFATEKEIAESRIKNMLTSLFDVIYQKRIPFPFDGFHTSRGNAARDCQLFIKELLIGNFDREWISARNAQQRNRAYELFDRSWGAIDLDGSIRSKPSNNSVRDIIEILDRKLRNANSESRPLNLGKIFRMLFLPPYGCNIASAGLLVALFISKRRTNINFMKDAQIISVETWLQDAMPKNYFELSILDLTDIVLISEESISEWEFLLDEWSIELAYMRKAEHLKKASELKKRIPLPAYLYYKYKLMHEHSLEANNQLNIFNNTFDNAISKIENGIAMSDAGLISWGTANLSELYHNMQNDGTKWLPEQVQEVEDYLSKGKIQTQQHFKEWLLQQKINSIEQFGKFKHHLVNRVGSNLQDLELDDEYEELLEHVEKIEKNIELLTEIKNASNNIDAMLQGNKITSTTPLSTLNNLLEQINIFKDILWKGKRRIDISQTDIDEAFAKLEKFDKECKEQIFNYNERAMNLYGIGEINTISDLENLKAEVATLILIFEGRADDIEDFKLIQKQLEIIEKHYRMLNDFNINTEEFEKLCIKAKEEVESSFDGDVPPLDNELIYNGIIRNIIHEREKYAEEWMLRNVPMLQEINNFDASTAMDYKTKLLSKPLVLSLEQSKKVNSAFAACIQRLDDLEIEGLLVRFNALSMGNRKKFIQLITEKML